MIDEYKVRHILIKPNPMKTDKRQDPLSPNNKKLKQFKINKIDKVIISKYIDSMSIKLSNLFPNKEINISISR